jgi:hypothetical protein
MYFRNSEGICISWYNSNKKKLTPEIETRITNTNTAYYAPLPLAKNQSVLITEEIKIYRSLIRPVATYVAISWTENSYIACLFERRALRRMRGEIKVNENWRKRYNKELMQLFAC